MGPIEMAGSDEKGHATPAARAASARCVALEELVKVTASSPAAIAIRSLALALVVWTELPADGSIGLIERAAWAPSLGIEYHLGVDGLGALMLVLSAIVTLMSVDAAHRVHHQPGLYFGLVLVLEAGLFGSFTALNFFHWFLFWELSLIPAFFLIKLWGGARRGPAATQFFAVEIAAVMPTWTPVERPRDSPVVGQVKRCPGRVLEVDPLGPAHLTQVKLPTGIEGQHLSTCLRSPGLPEEQ